MSKRPLPDATVARLPLYLRVLVAAAESGQRTVSSDELATASGVTSAKVRKDLSFLQTTGTRGIGYAVPTLTDEISAVLGLAGERPLVIVGIGNLGRALVTYDGFSRRGFRVVALLDVDPRKLGTSIGGLVIEDLADLEGIVADRGTTIAVLATPAHAAQAVAERLVGAGVTAILNFAPTHLDLPAHVTIRKVDVSTELQILSFYERAQKGQLAAGA
ncbi:MAG: redox-sensing transcriptional repressor Rex [Nitriliruptorales bacterium]|nr:redox-sensing transcriptional repressor Rex [Nitriliruptorales bacterium]